MSNKIKDILSIQLENDIKNVIDLNLQQDVRSSNPLTPTLS